MNIDFRVLLHWVIVIVLQCILDNYVDLGIYTRIVLLPYLILTLPYRYLTISSMVLAFLTGLCVDIFTTGVLGLNAGALVGVAFVRQKMLHSFIDERNIERHDSPDVKAMGTGRSIFYVFFSHLVFFTLHTILDNFGFTPAMITIPKIAIGTVVSGLIGYILFRNHKKV